MACACNSGKFVVSVPAGDGKPARTLEFRTRVEASAAARRTNGTYQKVS